MEINNTGSTYGAAFRQKPIFFMSGKETVAFFEGKLKKNMTLPKAAPAPAPAPIVPSVLILF